MAKVLTTNSTISCQHGASYTPNSSAKLLVNGKPVLLKPDAPSYALSGACTQTNASSSQVACAAIVTADNGDSGKLRSNGIVVLLDTMNGTTSGSPVKGLTCTANQNLLTAD